MEPILTIDNLNSFGGNMLRQGDKSQLKYRLRDVGNKNLGISGKSCEIKMYGRNYTTVVYETTTTVSSDNTVTFTIDKVLPKGTFYLEFTVGDYIFPTDHKEFFEITPSGKGVESNIIEIVGVDTVVRKAVDLINVDPSLIIDEDKLVTDIISNTGIGNINEYYQAFNDLKPKAEQSISRSLEALSKSQNALNVANGIDAKATNALSLSESADALSKSVQEQFNQIVINGDSSVEAAQARVDASGQTNPTLKARLDKEHNEVTAQLAQTVTEVSKKIGNGKLATMADMGQDVKEAMTGGSVAVVGKNSVVEDNIVDGQVTPKKTNVFNSGTVNFFNKETAKRGQLTPATGETVFGEAYGYYVSDFIPVENVEEIYTNENIANYVLYDADSQYLSGGNGPIKRLTIPSECVKLRFSFWNTHLEYFILSDKVVDKYVSYYTVKNEHLGALDGSNINDGTLTYEKTNFLKKGYNLFNPSRVSLGKYVEPISGGLTSSARYNTTDYIEYKAGDAFNATTVRTIAFYDKKYNVLEGTGIAETENPTNYGFITPNEDGYMRISYLAETENFQITKGINPKPYMIPTASLLKDVFVEPENILDDVKNKDEKQKNISTSLSIKEAMLVDGEQIKVEQNSIKKNKTLSFYADIDTFSGIRIGHGEGTYGASYIEIDEAEIRIYNKNTDAELQVTFNHELELSDFISIFMKVDEESLITIQLITNAGSYKTEPYLWNGYNGSPFAKSLGSIFRNCELVFDSADYQKTIFAFGDSYVGLTVEDRWPYYIKEYGYDNWLLNGFPGQNSLSSKAMFDSILQKNTPEIVFWGLGMNDGDSDSVNQNWLSVYNYVKEYCNANNIELILATIPNTPSINNAYKNDIVRSSGYRYVDFNKAVGADKDVNWYSGMLHTDNVHPTILGAKQLANRALLDFPELARS